MLVWEVEKSRLNEYADQQRGARGGALFECFGWEAAEGSGLFECE